MAAYDEEPSSGSNFGRYQELYKGHTTLELIRALARVRGERDEAEAVYKESAAEHDYLAKIAIPEHFQDEGIKNMNVEGLGRVSLRSDIYASVKAGMKAAMQQWLNDRGNGDLIQPAVPPSTLKAFLKGLIKAGEEYPEELFNVTPYQTATITKA